MTKWRYTAVILSFLLLVALAIWGMFIQRWPVQFIGESPVEYSMRRLKTVDNHVLMPNGAEAWVHTILSSGADGMEVLTREVIAGNGEGTRFSPTPGEMLHKFGEAGRMRLYSEFYRLKAVSLLSNEDCLAKQAEVTRVVTALVLQWSDDTLLLEWTDLMSRGNEALKGMGQPLSELAIRSVKLRNFESNRLNTIAQMRLGQNCPLLTDEMTADEVDALKKWINERRGRQ